jgi:hypothetical protein
MIVSAVLISTSAAVLGIAWLCGSNILQSRQVTNNMDLPPMHLPSANGESSDTVKHLQSLNRQELLELFKSCEVPADLSDIEGDWDGTLLENNGLIMTKVSDIMINGLFALGSGRRWVGKRFGENGESGINRFFNKNTNSHDTKISSDVSIHDSSLHAGKPCIRLSYFNHQSAVSPWKTMVGELRSVPGYDDVLLGMAAMAWSGGSAMSVPFCLHRVPKKISDEEEGAEV